jgi:hypothetical protein
MHRPYLQNHAPFLTLFTPDPQKLVTAVAHVSARRPVRPEAHVFAARGWFYTDLCVTSYLCVTSLHVLHLDRLAANVPQKPLLGCSRDVNAVRHCRILVGQDTLVAVSRRIDIGSYTWQAESRLKWARLELRIRHVCMLCKCFGSRLSQKQTSGTTLGMHKIKLF